MLVFAASMPASNSYVFFIAILVLHLSLESHFSSLIDLFIMYDFTLACFERALQLADDQTSADVWCGIHREFLLIQLHLFQGTTSLIWRSGWEIRPWQNKRSRTYDFLYIEIKIWLLGQRWLQFIRNPFEDCSAMNFLAHMTCDCRVATSVDTSHAVSMIALFASKPLIFLSQYVRSCSRM